MNVIDRLFAGLFVALLVVVVGGFSYLIIGTYNERAECQKLGIPLYRCESNSVQADVKVGQ